MNCTLQQSWRHSNQSVSDDPGAIQTTPVLLTVAMPSSSDDHSRLGLAISEPAASITVAVTVAVSPGSASTTAEVYSTIDAAACSTVTEALSDAEPEVAVIVAEPLPTDVTRPVDETVAIASSADVHVTVASDMRTAF